MLNLSLQQLHLRLEVVDHLLVPLPELLLQQLDALLMAIPLHFDLHVSEGTSMLSSSMRLVALLRARSFILFSLSRCSTEGESHLSVVYSSEKRERDIFDTQIN